MTTNDAAIEALLDAPEFVQDPYPAYRALLAKNSPHWSDTRRAWLVSRYGDVVHAFRDWEHFSSAGRVGTMLDHLTESDWRELDGLKRWTQMRGIIHADPPEHARFRTLFTHAFTTKAIATLEPKVAQIVDQLIADFPVGEVDLIERLALPLPASVISQILNVPDSDRDKFVAWSDAALGIQGRERPSVAVAKRASDAYAELQAYFFELIEERRSQGLRASDFVANMLRITDEDSDMDDADVMQSCITLLMGGYETTTRRLSISIWCIYLSLVANLVACLK